MRCIFNIYSLFTFSLTISSASMLTFNTTIANFQQMLLKYSLLIVLATTSFALQAQVTLSLTYTEKNNKTTILAGDFYTMQLNYSVSSTTGNASGVKAVINIPDFVHVVGGFVGTTDAPAGNFVYDGTPGAKKLTINFTEPVSSGSTGVLEFNIVTANLITPDNTVLATSAELTANGGSTSGVKNHSITVTATPSICAKKTFISGGAIDNETKYRITVQPGYNEYRWLQNGALSSSNISIVDQLPAGATFVSAKVYDQDGVFLSNALESGGIVTATIPNFTAFYNNGQWQGSLFYVDIILVFPSPTFSSGNTVTNTATVNYTPLGQAAAVLTDGLSIGGQCTSDLIEVTTLNTATTAVTFSKVEAWNSNPNVFPGKGFTYAISFTNSGNTPLNDVELIDDIPANIKVLQSNGAERGIGTNGSSFPYLDHVEYQTNLSGSWTSFAPLTYFQIVPLLPSGEYFTKLKFVLISPLPPNATFAASMVFTPLTEVTTSENVTNCMYWNSSTAGIPALADRTSCSSFFNLQPRPSTAKIQYYASHSPGCGPSGAIGQVYKFNAVVAADAGFSDANMPVAGMLIPSGFDYVPGSEVFTANSSGITTTPTLEIIENYVTFSGHSKDLYRWTFAPGTILPYGTDFKVSVDAKATAALAPAIDYQALIMASASNSSLNQPFDTYFNTLIDPADWDANGVANDEFRTASSSNTSCQLFIAASASMQSIKWVKGQCDTEYSRFPNFGLTVPGGNADYKLIVKNSGNVPMKDIKIIDILPFVGDRGVIDPSPRATEWRPNLADPISAPAGITVLYSTETNPCRDEVKQPTDPSPFPTGCAAANWSTTPPADITKVQAVKIDFGTTVLGGGDSLIFNWPMRAPVNAPTNNEIAWNSFGFVATRTDNNTPLIAAEPIKVGIKVKAGAPGFYGDRVWFDTNKDGIQDPNEGGVDGVKVKLFSPKVSGLQDPLTDSLINFTITGNGGFYRFSNLPASDYYAVFCLPVGYSTSPKDAASSTDANDSDGTEFTYLGEVATMVPATSIGALEEDYTWDQGIFCSFTPTVTPIQNTAFGNSVTLTATGGTNYLWSGPNGFTATTASITINNVSPQDTGVYSVNIATGSCYASLTTGIGIGVSCVPPNSLVLTQTAPTCTGATANNDGKITLTAATNADKFGVSSGATYAGPDYANASTIALPQDVQTAIPNAGGSYTIRLFNGADDCFKDTTIMVDAVTCNVTCNLTASVTGTPITCNGYNNGSVSATATGNTGGVTYIWSNAASTPSLSGLSPATYTVTITEVTTNCTATSSYVVIEPSVITTDCSGNGVSTINGADGSASVTASGGTAPYTYAWSNGANTASISNLTIDTYTVTVSDANDCSATCEVSIIGPGCSIIAANAVVTCNNNGTDSNPNDDYFTVTLNPTGSDLGATYSVSGGITANNIAYGSPQAVGGNQLISAGNLSITITDDATGGCELLNIPITAPNTCSVPNCPPTPVCLPIIVTKQ